LNNIAVVLSGGIGTRLGGTLPKQYIELAGKPVLVHTLEQFQRCQEIDCVIVVASPIWERQIFQWKENFHLSKLVAVAVAGENRQQSIRNGLLAAQSFADQNDETGVIIQDAVRPLASVKLLTRLIQGLQEAPGVLPALPVTDTTYTSQDGQWVGGLLDRSTLFSGQAPEAFRYWPYLKLYQDTSEEVFNAMSGSCQLPYRADWKIKLISGERENVKITYTSDLALCEKRLRERNHIS